MNRSVIEKVKEEVEARRQEITDLCSSLVKFPTVNPPGKTREAVDFIQSYFEKAGIKTEIHERREGKANIRAVIPGGRKGKILWLGHLDVVPEGDRALWKYDPYGGVVVGERIYGRGSSDMKGSCASAMVAARILSALDPSHICTSEFWFTCDEETGAKDGVKWLAERGKLSGDVCIIGDSLGLTPETPVMDVGCKGGVTTIITAEGAAAHGSVPFMGENAIEKLITAIRDIRKIEELRLDVPEVLEPVIASSIELYKKTTKLTEAQKTKLDRLFHYPTASLNIIRGGVKSNVVPDRAEALFDVRVTPGANIEAVKKEISRLLGASGVEGVKVEFKSHEGYYEDPNSKPVKALMETVEAAIGTTPKLKLLTGGTDAIFLKMSVDIPCIGFGAGVQGTAHINNEYVTIPNLITATKVYAVFPLLYDVSAPIF